MTRSSVVAGVALAASDDGVNPDTGQLRRLGCQNQAPARRRNDDSSSAIRHFEFIPMIDKNVWDFREENNTVWFLLFLVARNKFYKKSLE